MSDESMRGHGRLSAETPENRANRAQMISAIRRHPLSPQPLPELSGPWIRYPSKWEQFRISLESVGGQLRHVEQFSDVLVELEQIEAYRSAQKRIVCLACFEDTKSEGIAGVAAATEGSSSIVGHAISSTADTSASLESIVDAHELSDVDFAVVPGELGVAENGAIYVTDREIRHRALCFIAQHLSIVFAAERIVDTMHDAYQQIEFDDNRFRCFISGPSKTADIEQSLVIGAHGARSLTVITYGQRT